MKIRAVLRNVYFLANHLFFVSFSVFFSRNYSLTNLETSFSNLVKETIFPSSQLRLEKADFFNYYPVVTDHLDEVTIFSPEVNLYTIYDAGVIARTEFVFRDNQLFIPELIQPENDAFMFEIEGWGKYSPEQKKVRMYNGVKSLKLPKAISLFGQANGNYAHWLTESLSRLAIVNTANIPLDVPILVEDGLHPRLYEALDLLNIHCRKIIRVKNYRKVKISTLYYVSPPSYTRPAPREFILTKRPVSPSVSGIYFSKDSILNLANQIREIAANYEFNITSEEFKSSVEEVDGNLHFDFSKFLRIGVFTNTYNSDLLFLPKDAFLFIKRDDENVGNGRLINNSSEIELVAKINGCFSIDPAKLSFANQVNLFKNRRLITGAVGAGMANLIFTDPGCEVILLSPSYPNANFSYFSLLLSTLGHKLKYVIGVQDTNSLGSIENRNFQIPSDIFNNQLAESIEKLVQ